MNFEQIQYFAAVAEELSFTRASERLFVSQPTLSRHVSALERELGVQLMYRDNRVVKLTPAGLLFLEKGRELLYLRDSLTDEIAALSRGLEETFSVASLALYYPELGELFREYRERFPQVRVRMSHHNTGSIAEYVENERADIGFCFSFELPNKAETLQVLPLFHEDFRLITAEDNPLAERGTICLKDIRGQKLRFLQKYSFPSVNEMWRRAELANVITEEPLKQDDMESLLLEVRAGDGSAIIPAPIARSYRSGCRIIPIEDLISDFDVVALWRKDGANPALKRFTGHLRDRFK